MITHNGSCQHCRGKRHDPTCCLRRGRDGLMHKLSHLGLAYIYEFHSLVRVLFGRFDGEWKYDGILLWISEQDKHIGRRFYASFWQRFERLWNNSQKFLLGHTPHTPQLYEAIPISPASREPSELLQWLCYDDSTINIVVVINWRSEVRPDWVYGCWYTEWTVSRWSCWNVAESTPAATAAGLKALTRENDELSEKVSMLEGRVERLNKRIRDLKVHFQ